MPDNPYRQPDYIAILAAGCIAFGCLFYATMVAASLVLHRPLTFWIASIGIAVTYISYFAQTIPVPRKIAFGLVLATILFGAASFISLVPAFV